MNAPLAYGAAAVAILGVAQLDQLGYVTAGQRAALKVFNATGPRIAPTVADAVSHIVDAASAITVCQLVLQAAHDGATVNDPNAGGGEAYCPLADPAQWFMTSGAFTEIFGNGGQEMVWANLTAYDDAQLSAFGVAAKQLMQATSALTNGTSSSAVPADLCNALAAQMDAAGVRAKKPEDVTLWSWTYDHTIGALLPSTTTLVIGAAVVAGVVYVAWRATR